MSDLAVLFPNGVDVIVNGELINIKPFTFGQLPKVTQLLQPVIGSLVSSGLVAFDGGDMRIADDWPMRMVEIMAAGEPLVELTALAAKKDRVFMDTIGMDDGVALVRATIEVNADMFSKKILPMVSKAVTAQAGGLPSDNLSLAGIDGATSTVTP